MALMGSRNKWHDWLRPQTGKVSLLWYKPAVSLSSVTHMISYVTCYTYDQLHVIYTQISFMSSATDMISFTSSATHDQLCHLLHTWPASCHPLHTGPATPNIITTGDGVESFHSCTCILLEQKTGFLQMGFSTYWAIQWSWFARVNALCNLSRKKSWEVAAHFRADFCVGVASGCV